MLNFFIPGICTLLERTTMQEYTYFNIQHWKLHCPESSNLAACLTALNESKTIRCLLDNLIDCILAVKSELTSQHDARTHNHLKKIRDNLYKLLALVTDTPLFLDQRETREILNQKLSLVYTIFGKRKIDPNYLPNHLLPGDDPPFVDPKIYDLYASAKKQPPESQDLYLNEYTLGNILASQEAALRERYRYQQLARVTREQKQKKYLFLQKEYYRIEALPKEIQQAEEIQQAGQYSLPTAKDVPGYFEKFRQAINRIDEIEFVPSDLNLILKNKLEIALNEAEYLTLSKIEQNGEYDPDRKLLIAPHYIKWTYLFLSKQLIEYEELYPKQIENLRTMKDILREVLSGPIDLQLLAYYKNYKAKNPALFESKNHHLLVSYFTPENREKYRVHLYQGRLYQFSREYTGLNFKLFNSKTNQSHKKSGWISFILNIHGEIFASSHGGEILHSSFMGGAPVIFAGEMKVDERGRILAVSNYSGHYMPELGNLQVLARHLHRRKVDLSACTFYKVEDQIISDKLDQLRNSRLPTEKIKEVEKEIEDDSQRLKFSTCYAFKAGGLVKTGTNGKTDTFSYKRTLLVLSLLVLGIAFLAFFGLVAAASFGIGIPVFLTFLAAVAGSASPLVAYVLPVVVCGVVSFCSFVGAGMASGLFSDLQHSLYSGFKKITNWFSPTQEVEVTPVNVPVNQQQSSNPLKEEEASIRGSFRRPTTSEPVPPRLQTIRAETPTPYSAPFMPLKKTGQKHPVFKIKMEAGLHRADGLEKSDSDHSSMTIKISST